MSHLFVPTAIETHLIAIHGIDASLISALHSERPELVADVVRLSHLWLHAATRAVEDCTSCP